jgi:heterodisulfide reductase subunit B
MTQINLSVSYELIRQLVYGADQYHADVIATLCPICQLNLDAYQGEVNCHFHASYRCCWRIEIKPQRAGQKQKRE